MPGLMLAAVNPDNTPHGYNWTFAFPMLLFIVIAAVLYMLFSRPHRRVPGRPITVVGAQRSDAGVTRATGATATGASASAPTASGATASTAPVAPDESPAEETEAGEGSE